MTRIVRKSTDWRLYRAVELSMAGESAPAVAAACHVSLRTLSRWRGMPIWRKMAAELAGHLVGLAADELRAASGRAVTELSALLRDGSATVRLRAAVAILEHAGRLVDDDIERRLARLEGSDAPTT